MHGEPTRVAAAVCLQFGMQPLERLYLGLQLRKTIQDHLLRWVNRRLLLKLLRSRLSSLMRPLGISDLGRSREGLPQV